MCTAALCGYAGGGGLRGLGQVPLDLEGLACAQLDAGSVILAASRGSLGAEGCSLSLQLCGSVSSATLMDVEWGVPTMAVTGGDGMSCQPGSLQLTSTGSFGACPLDSYSELAAASTTTLSKPAVVVQASCVWQSLHCSLPLLAPSGTPAHESLLFSQEYPGCSIHMSA